MKPTVRFALLTTAALCASAASAMPPRHVTLHYDVSRNGIAMVEVTATLQHDRRTYRIESEWRGKGLFALATHGEAVRSSRGVIGAHGLLPEVFRDQRGDAPVEVARFDWAKGILTRERNSRTTTVLLPPGTEDRLTFLYEFAFAPPARDAGVLRIPVADARGLSQNRYSFAGQETLRTPAGEFAALRLDKLRGPHDQRRSQAWFAVKHDYLPLRVLVIEKDGTRLDQVLTQIGP